MHLAKWSIWAFSDRLKNRLGEHYGFFADLKSFRRIVYEQKVSTYAIYLCLYKYFVFDTNNVVYTYERFFNSLFERIGFQPRLYVIFMVFYYFLKLTYIHIALCVILFICNILKEKKILYFVIVFADIAVNIFWLIFGAWYTVQ